jgi:DNA-binding CsgD family transcriptional regulator/tetratricopeptide (TPR) repeat protein
MRLLEREPYLEALATALGHAREGRGRIVLVSGEAGIGKTSLLREFAAQHAGKTRILWGGCEALFTPHPLAPLHDIARQIGGDFPAVLASASDRHEIFNATLDRFTRLEGPSFVFIEDAHWADEATLDLIKFLGRRLQDLGLVLAISYRDDEVNGRHPLRAVIGDLPNSCIARVQLPYLSAEAVAALAEAAGRQAEGLHEMTGGNAFFVTEVLAAPGDSMPATVRDAAIARLARLTDAARRVAHLVALVPGKAEHWLVQATVDPGNAAVQECLNAGMVALPDHALGFRHELARRAVADSMPATERRELNAAILTALLARGEGQVAMGRLVHHADQAGDSAAVLRLAPAAAEQASTLGSHREAAVHCATALRHGAALDDTARARLLEKRSYECYLTDQLPESLEARRAALALWRKTGARLEEGATLRWLSRLSWFSGQNAAALDYGRQAIQVLEPLPPSRELAMAYSNRSQLHMLAHELRPSVEWGEKAMALATTLGDTETHVHALTNIGTAKYGYDGVNGRDDLDTALQMALEHGYQEHVARAYTNLASNLNWSRNYQEAAECLQAGIAYCVERDLDAWSRYLWAQRADTWLALGEWDAAGLDADRVIQCPSSANVNKIPAFTALGRLRARRGDPDVESPLAEAYTLSVITGELQRLAPVLAARAEAAWLRGDDAAEILPALEQTYRITLTQADIWRGGELAFWMWRFGRMQSVPDNIAPPYALQIGGDWRSAAEAWASLGCPYEQASALADSDDEDALRRALETFERLGAGPMAGTVRRKLRALGVRGIPRGAQERTRQNPAGMTNQELKVLGLIVEGRRNADIARRLFVSEKTVGHHVSAVLAKLGVRSRGEAAAAAARLGLGPMQPESRSANK